MGLQAAGGIIHAAGTVKCQHDIQGLEASPYYGTHTPRIEPRHPAEEGWRRHLRGDPDTPGIIGREACAHLVPSRNVEGPDYLRLILGDGVLFHRILYLRVAASAD